MFAIDSSRPRARQFVFQRFGLAYSYVRMRGNIFEQDRDFLHYGLIARCSPEIPVLPRLLGEYYRIRHIRARKSLMLSPASWRITRPLSASSIPLRIAAIVAGDCIIYSVSLIALYSSKDSITTAAPPSRLTITVSESFITESRYDRKLRRSSVKFAVFITCVLFTYLFRYKYNAINSSKQKTALKLFLHYFVAFMKNAYICIS